MKVKQGFRNKMKNMMTLNSYIAHAGYASRRKAVELIKSGVVTVNHAKVTSPAYRVKPNDTVRIKGKPLKKEALVYILLNKPTNVITTVHDEESRNTVLDIVKVPNARLYPVGRLDRNTTGLLLLTNDGELAQKLAHPRYNVAKSYSVVLHRPLSEEDKEHIAKGIRLNDGMIRVDSIEYMRGAPKTCLHIELHSGKNRIVRRLFEALGYFIEKLDRTNYAGLNKKGLRVGQWRHLTAFELEKLQKIAGTAVIKEAKKK